MSCAMCLRTSQWEVDASMREVAIALILLSVSAPCPMESGLAGSPPPPSPLESDYASSTASPSSNVPSTVAAGSSSNQTTPQSSPASESVPRSEPAPPERTQEEIAADVLVRMSQSATTVPHTGSLKTQDAVPSKSDEEQRAPKRSKVSAAGRYTSHTSRSYMHTIRVIGGLARSLHQAPTDCWDGMTFPSPTTPARSAWLPFLLKLGLTPGEYPQIQVAGKAAQPRNCRREDGAPSWHFLMYTLLAVSPQGRLKLSTIFNLCLAWCSKLSDKNQTCRAALSRCTAFVSEKREDPTDGNGDWYRLASEGEGKVTRKGESKGDLEPGSGGNEGASGPETRAARRRRRGASDDREGT